DPEESRHRHRVSGVRAARRADRAPLSAGRRRPRDRLERRGVQRLLHRVDRGRRAGQPAHRLAVFRHVDPQPVVRRGRADRAMAHPQAGELTPWRGLERRGRCRARGDSLALFSASCGAQGAGAMSTLDRYLLREWTKVSLLAALGFPFLVMVIDLTDKLDTYLGRRVTKGRG